WALFLAASALGCGTAGAVVGALVFTVFPPAQDSVASVVGRCDVLAALFCLLGWRAQILWQRGSIGSVRAFASVFWFGLLAMLGKESGVVFVGAAGLTAIVFLAAASREPGQPPAGRGPRGQIVVWGASV